MSFDPPPGPAPDEPVRHLVRPWPAAVSADLPGAEDVTEYRQFLRRERRAMADQSDGDGGIRARRVRVRTIPPISWLRVVRELRRRLAFVVVVRVMGENADRHPARSRRRQRRQPSGRWGDAIADWDYTPASSKLA
jgi:hypothetical protein